MGQVSPKVLGEVTPNPMSCCSALNHRPGHSSLSCGNAAEMDLAVGLQVLPESLWGHGDVCVPCVTHVLSASGGASVFLILLTVPDAFTEE